MVKKTEVKNRQVVVYFLAVGTVIASSLVVIAMLPGNQHRLQEVTGKNRNSQNKGDVTCLLVSLRCPGRQI